MAFVRLAAPVLLLLLLRLRRGGAAPGSPTPSLALDTPLLLHGALRASQQPAAVLFLWEACPLCDRLMPPQIKLKSAQRYISRYISRIFHFYFMFSSSFPPASLPFPPPPKRSSAALVFPPLSFPPTPTPPPPPRLLFKQFKPSKSFFFRVRTPPPKLFSRSRLPFMKGSNVEVQHTRTYNYTHNNYTHNNCTHNNYTHNNYAHNTTHITI
jgi:hypothetical protein